MFFRVFSLLLLSSSSSFTQLIFICIYIYYIAIVKSENGCLTLLQCNVSTCAFNLNFQLISDRIRLTNDNKIFITFESVYTFWMGVYILDEKKRQNYQRLGFAFFYTAKKYDAIFGAIFSFFQFFLFL